MKNIAYSKYYIINTVKNTLDVYDDLNQVTLYKQVEHPYKFILDNGEELWADDSHADFHFWGGPQGEYDIYFEVYLVELEEGDFDPEIDLPIEDDLFIKDQKRVGFIKSGKQIIYND